MLSLIFLYITSVGQGAPINDNEVDPNPISSALEEPDIEVLAIPLALDAVEEPDIEPLAIPLALDGVDAVVVVTQGQTVCAGVLLGNQGQIATAYHCIANGGKPRVEFQDGSRFVGTVSHWSVRGDLAIIDVVDLVGTQGLDLAVDPPMVGEVVQAIGHPYGARIPSGFFSGTLRWAVTEGMVSAVGEYAIQLTAEVNKGNSGGPIINDEGQVIGIVSRRLTGDGLGFATRGYLLRELLEAPASKLGLLGGTLGMECFVGAFQGLHGAAMGGCQLEAVFRDHLTLSISGAFGNETKWDAVRYGEVSWPSAELHLGYRQRVFRGEWTVFLDVYGGGALLNTQTGDANLSLERTYRFSPMVGGAIRMGMVGFDVAYIFDPERPGLRYSLILRWPGVFWTF